MNALNRFLTAAGTVLRRAWHALKAQPFGILGAVCAVAAVVLLLPAPWQLQTLLNDLNLAVARRLAATGIADSAPMQGAATRLLVRTACAMALYVGAIRCALVSAKKLRGDLRAAVQQKRAAHEAAGHTPPPDWEQDVNRDIDHISAMIAAAPEWLLLLAGVVFSVLLLVRAPFSAAIAAPVTAVGMCVLRDTLRQKRVSRALQIVASAALWGAGTFYTLHRAAMLTEPAVAPGTLAVLLLGMALIVPGALQLPYRNLKSAWAAFRRVHDFLK